MTLPEEYTIQKFFQLAGYPKQKYGGRVYEAGCPVCREGSSWKKKRRLYYVVDNNLIYCHNCGWSGDPLKFIKQVEGLNFNEIVTESKKYNLLPVDVFNDNSAEDESKELHNEDLPLDSINLLDNTQIEYYQNNKIVVSAVNFLKKRRLDTAINKPKSIYTSLNDYVHKNRLILPFYDLNNDVVFYQTRTIIEDTVVKLPKYLSKIGGEKSLFNINNVTDALDKIYIFEGPIDSCFVRNGVGVAGIQENSDLLFSNKQSNQLSIFNVYEKIWVLDSQWIDRASRNKTKKLIENNQKVFIWPKEYGTRFKDFNDMCIDLNTNEIPHTFIDKNTYVGLKGKLMLSQICP